MNVRAMHRVFQGGSDASTIHVFRRVCSEQACLEKSWTLLRRPLATGLHLRIPRFAGQGRDFRTSCETVFRLFRIEDKP